MGKARFKDFLLSNPDISTKMLSERLKELEMNGIIKKEIVQKTPLTVIYQLTNKGKSLNKVLRELAMFSLHECSDEVMCNKRHKKQFINKVKETFGSVSHHF